MKQFINSHFQLEGKGPWDSGLISLRTADGAFSECDFSVAEQASANSLVRALRSSSARVEIRDTWKRDPRTGICWRRLLLKNISSKEVRVLWCLCRFPLRPDVYELYTMSSCWGNEHQGTWRQLHAGTLDLSCEGGRTNQGASPLLGVRDITHRQGLVFHVLPTGNWLLRAAKYTSKVDGVFAMVVEAGLAERHLDLRVLPHETVRFPEVLIQPLENGDIHEGAATLHSFLLRRQARPARFLPLSFNTWHDAYASLRVQRLRRQLTAAKRIGCRYFVIDAGWYGQNAGTNWQKHTGDWRENKRQAFKGRMGDFADEVRKAGLKFGLWMEPERVCAKAPAFENQKHLLVPGARPKERYFDLGNPQAASFMFKEICTIIDKYAVEWLKIDFNGSMGIDRSGAEFNTYYKNLFALLGRLRKRYPGLILEGCASGGMRLDCVNAAQYDFHYLTDQTEVVNVLRLGQSMLLNNLPGMLGKWTILRGRGEMVYNLPQPEHSKGLLTPFGFSGYDQHTVDLDFAALVNMAGAWELSGDIASLPAAAMARLARHAAFYRKWNLFIRNSLCHLLTPPRPMTDHRGFVGLQFSSPPKSAHLLFAYRLDNGSGRNIFRLRGLQRKRSYRVTGEFGEAYFANKKVSGVRLMDEGLEVELPHKFTAKAVIVS